LAGRNVLALHAETPSSAQSLGIRNVGGKKRDCGNGTDCKREK